MDAPDNTRCDGVNDDSFIGALVSLGGEADEGVKILLLHLSLENFSPDTANGLSCGALG